MSVLRLLDLVFIAVAVLVVLPSAYLLALAALSWRGKAPPYGQPHLKFDVVIPAHDEERGIAAAVRSALAMDYPAPLRRVLVVADNCADATAERAREAGATVLVRDAPGLRGKGYALAHAFEHVLADPFGADAVVVVDADTVVSPNLLHAFAARLDAGASVVQADYVVANPGANWRTSLLAVAFALVNTMRSLARERLRCSTGLRGNGMAMSTRALREVPHDAFSVVEDLEYGIRLGAAGHRVHFAADAKVQSDMVTSAGAARSQRLRWEAGRLPLVLKHGLPFVLRGMARRDRVLLDLGLDLLTPPLAFLAAAAVLGTAACVAASWSLGHPLAATWLWGSCVVALLIYVLRGWWISGTGMQGLSGLLHAPLYLLWKLGLVLDGRLRRGSGAWIRTTREQ